MDPVAAVVTAAAAGEPGAEAELETLISTGSLRELAAVRTHTRVAIEDGMIHLMLDRADGSGLDIGPYLANRYHQLGNAE